MYIYTYYFLYALTVVYRSAGLASHSSPLNTRLITPFLARPREKCIQCINVYTPLQVKFPHLESQRESRCWVFSVWRILRNRYSRGCEKKRGREWQNETVEMSHIYTRRSNWRVILFLHLSLFSLVRRLSHSRAPRAFNFLYYKT